LINWIVRLVSYLFDLWGGIQNLGLTYSRSKDVY